MHQTPKGAFGHSKREHGAQAHPPFQKDPPNGCANCVQQQLLAGCVSSKPGVGGNLNPRELIAGCKIDCNKHCQLEFGDYVQLHEEHNNTMAARTTGALAI